VKCRRVEVTKLSVGSSCGCHRGRCCDWWSNDINNLRNPDKNPDQIPMGLVLVGRIDHNGSPHLHPYRAIEVPKVFFCFAQVVLRNSLLIMLSHVHLRKCCLMTQLFGSASGPSLDLKPGLVSLVSYLLCILRRVAEKALY
jgi:hypothetical protein